MPIPTTLKSAIGAVVVLCFCSLARAAADAPPAGDTVTITFKVKPAPGTPADAKLYLAGDAKALGEWKADGVKLNRGEDGIYSGKVELPRDKQVEYKVTRGSWETVEKNADGSELNNRTLTPTKDATVEIEVKKWADAAKFSPGGEKPAEKKSTRSGDIRVHAKFPSRFVDARDVLVYLPPGYGHDPQRRYPVLYMHDGQNVFDAATSFLGVEWCADETATRLIEEKGIEPLIIVAIASTKDRIDEYTLSRNKRLRQGGNGEAYMRFVATEVKPFIDTTYRTRPDRQSTGVGGSSLGGLISVEICRHYPGSFGNCIAMSPAMWWGNDQPRPQVPQDSGWMRYCRFWIDVGTREGEEQLRGLRWLEASFVVQGLAKGADYDSLVAEGAGHNEQAWGERLDKALMFLFPPEPPRRPPYNPANGHPTPTPAPDPAAPHDVAAR